jgi:hypothetical protein
MKEIYIHVEELNGRPEVGRSLGARRRWGPGARSRAWQPQQRVRVTYDECYLVLSHTPLFMFVRPLALLIFNNLTCFVYFVISRPLHHVLIKGANLGRVWPTMAKHSLKIAQKKKTLSTKWPRGLFIDMLKIGLRLNAGLAFERASYLRSNAQHTVNRR